MGSRKLRNPKIPRTRNKIHNLATSSQIGVNRKNVEEEGIANLTDVIFTTNSKEYLDWFSNPIEERRLYSFQTCSASELLQIPGIGKMFRLTSNTEVTIDKLFGALHDCLNDPTIMEIFLGFIVHFFRPQVSHPRDLSLIQNRPPWPSEILHYFLESKNSKKEMEKDDTVILFLIWSSKNGFLVPKTFVSNSVSYVGEYSKKDGDFYTFQVENDTVLNEEFVTRIYTKHKSSYPIKIFSDLKTEDEKKTMLTLYKNSQRESFSWIIHSYIEWCETYSKTHPESKKQTKRSMDRNQLLWKTIEINFKNAFDHMKLDIFSKTLDELTKCQYFQKFPTPEFLRKTLTVTYPVAAIYLNGEDLNCDLEPNFYIPEEYLKTENFEL